jgi:hypothetical protein
VTRRLPLAALVAGLLAATATAAAPSAQAALPGANPLAPVIGVPGNIATPDLTGQGLPDLVVPEFGADLLAVRLNEGNGSFGPVQRYPVGLKPSFIAVGDFNRDGKLDLAVSNAGSGDVSVLLNKGDGTFLPARNYSVSSPSGGLSTGTFSLEAVELTGKGILDLVTANSVSNDVSVLIGNGDGTFQPAHTYSIGTGAGQGMLPFALSVLPLGGGRPDDLVVGGLHGVTLMAGDGHGAFHPLASYPVGLDIACTRVADLNGDGKDDLVATGTGTFNAQVFLGNGDGTFTPGEDLFSGGFGPQCFSIARLSAGGNLDLAIVNSSSAFGTGDLAVLDGDGRGQFDLAAEYPVGIAPWASSVADFNHNGGVDVAVANTGPTASVTILYGNGQGGFARKATYGM